MALGPRAEVHQIAKGTVSIGSGPAADLRVPHSSVYQVHARLLARRGRLLLVGAGGAQRAVRVGNRPVYAPVVLAEGAVFGLGEVELSAELAPPGWAELVGRPVEGHTITVERPASGGLRRFSLSGSDAELLVSGQPAGEVEAWVQAMRDSVRPEQARRLAALTEVLELEGSAAFIEALGPGVRLARALAEAAEDRVTIPLPARLHILAEIAAALGALHARAGAHGALDPDHVSLGIDGSVSVLRAGPAASPARRYASPERRRGGRASKAADSWGLARVAATLQVFAEPGLQDLKRLFLRLSRPEPERRPLDLLALSEEVQAAAVGLGLDPSTGHTARLARLLYSSPEPIAGVQLAPPLLVENTAPPL